MNYYNEFDPGAAAWLRELIAQNLIPAGHVDTRSILDVQPGDLAGYNQCHFFAGIGGWALALRLAGWPDDQPVWTGSCPCQPFSAAGKQQGVADERHLWPEFRRLISECRPPVVFGEQVASSLGRDWLAGVRADLEGLAYEVGAADLCAAGVGAPHIRQRLYWGGFRVADSDDAGPQGRGRAELRECSGERASRESCDAGGLDHAAGARREEHGSCLLKGVGEGCEAGRLEHSQCDGREQRRAEPGGWGSAGGCKFGGLADAVGERRTGERVLLRPETGRRDEGGVSETPGSGGTGFWDAYDLIPCRDGKVRRIEPGTFPLAHGVSGRVGLLRGYGNAIVPQVAAAFVEAFDSCLK